MAIEFHRPTNVEVDRERKLLRIEWQDEVATEYGFEDLRRRCPCAICAGEGGFKGTMSPTAPLRPEQLDLVDWTPVGRYGLSPRWGDGHDTGIFTFKMLRLAAGLKP
jgi:DUF971 family protein